MCLYKFIGQLLNLYANAKKTGIAQGILKDKVRERETEREGEKEREGI